VEICRLLINDKISTLFYVKIITTTVIILAWAALMIDSAFLQCQDLTSPEMELGGSAEGGQLSTPLI
jgi:hypothetical protein